MPEGPAVERAHPAVLEPRFYARVDFSAEAVVVQRGRESQGTTLNLSEGGVAVRVSGVPPEPGEIVVSFRLPGRAEAIRVEGRVVRAVDRGEGESELAIAFELSDADAADVRRFVTDRAGIAWEPAGAALPRDVALRFIPLIRRIAKGLAKRLPPDVAIDDLVGSGFVTLVELYRQHPDLGIESFEQLATSRLRYAMLDELRDNDPLSRRMRKKATDVARARFRLEGELGRPAGRAELARSTGLSEAAIEEAERLATTGAARGRASFDDVDVADAERPGPEEGASRAESLDRLRIALDALPARHRKVLELYYGDDLTLREIGNLLGVTEARISQLVSDAVKKLRTAVPSA